MHTTPSLTFTAFAVLLMTSTVGNTETGRITGQFGNERLELRIEDGDPLSDVGLDFRQTPAGIGIDFDLLVLTEASDGYTGLILFLEFETEGNATRNQVDGATLKAAEIMIVEDWPLDSADPVRGWEAELDVTEDIIISEFTITDDVLAFAAQVESDRFCLYDDISGFDPTPVREEGVYLCQSGEIALRLGAAGDRK